MKKSIHLFFLTLFFFIASVGHAAIYVDINATGTNSGTSWTNAYVALQDAINASSIGDSIWVAAGTYKPTLLPSTGGASTTSRDLSFYLDKNIKIYGGFAGTETTFSQRNTSANQVTLSGDIGTAGDNTDNSYHVFIMNNLSTAAVLDGFILTGGNANAGGSFWSGPSFSGQTFPRRGGGALCTIDVDIDIDNVVITTNNSIEYGGAAFFIRSEPTIDNSVIYNNSAVYGGGIYSFQSSNPKLTNVTVCYNSASDATYGGGGIYTNSGNVTLKNVLFWGNTKAGSDNIARADIWSNNTVTRSYCMTQLNSTHSSGTGMVTAGTNPSFVNASDPDGADNIWMTRDDGLVLSSTSAGIGAGTSSSAPSYDITNKVRPTTPSIGAYEEFYNAAIYVDINATGTNSGTSWTNAYVALQDAINASSIGDSIWVAAGTYKPTLLPSTGGASTTSRDLSFYLDKNIKIYGGFAGTETTFSQRNTSANQVTLSGDIGTAGDNADNCHHVFIMDGLSSSAKLDGFIITGGNADAPGVWYAGQSFSGQTFGRRTGGGLMTIDTDIDIDNVVIVDNSAIQWGGGCFFIRSELTMDNSVIYNNSSSDKGGGIYAFQQTCNPRLTNVTVCYNSAADGTHGGGGLYANSANYTLKNVIFWGNTMNGNDNVSGADINTGQPVTRSYCMTQANSGYSSGTGMVTAGTNPSFVNASDPDGADNIWMTRDDGLVLSSTSAGIGAGTSSGAPSNDINNNTRPTTPSIGAYEEFYNVVSYVDINATGTNSGTSWTNAYVALQDAINASSIGDSIWVAAGTYKPTLLPSTGGASTTSRDLSFYLDKNIKIYGGFAGTETTFSQRNTSANQVTLSGDIGTAGDNTDNSYHVFIMNNLSTAAVLDGFILTGGNANAGGSFWSGPSFSGQTFPRRGGGALCTIDVDIDIDNVVITTNNSIEYGGAAFFIRSEPTIDNSVIYNNSAVYGGGIYSFQSSNPKLTNVTVCYNSASDATYGGGGIYTNSGNVTLKNVLFWGNTKAGSDNIARADIWSNNTVTRSYCMTQLNSTHSSGTGMVTAGTNPSFVNASDPDGADNIWMTGDDGLVLSSTSAGIGAGTSSSAPSYDITNKVRPTTPSIGAYEGKICKLSNNLPTVPATYTSSFASADGSYTCYCDDNQNLILALDLNSTGAVVPTTGVSLEIGATTTTSWSTAGGIITNANGGAIINRKWDVAPTTQPTSDVTVIYPFTHTEYGDVATALGVLGTTITNVNQLEMYKLTSAGTFADPHASGAAGVGLAHGASASTSYWVWSQHGNGTDHLATYKVSSFSGGGGGGGASGNPLPVELIHFDAQATYNHTADLHWATASETNNSHFEIERSYDGRTFETVGNVTGNGTTSHLIDYNYTDETIAKSQNTAYYRLKQVDYDGAYEYSDVRVVRFDGRAEMLEIAAYPNPFNQEVTIRVNANEPYTIEVTDINGVVVLSVDHTESRTHRLDVSEYTAGVYIIEVTSTQGTKHLKVIKQ